MFAQDITVPANTTRWNNDVLKLGQRLRRWPNIKTSLFQRVVFAGVLGDYCTAGDVISNILFDPYDSLANILHGA